MVASCSNPAEPPSKPITVAPLPSGTPEVAYGASLSEWEEATQDEVEQTVDSTESDNASSVTAEDDGAVTVDSTESDNASSVTAEDDDAVTVDSTESDNASSVTAEDDVGQTVDSTESDNASSVTAEDEVEQTVDSTESDNASSVTAEDDDAVTAQGTVPTIGPPPITAEAAAPIIGTSITVNNIVYQEIMWDGLIPANFRPDAIMEKYQEQLDEAEDGSPEASELYTKMQEEFNRAPVNEVLDETLVRLPGFIAPLNYSDDLITEFLLVPYFGACIHTPAPPANQTVLVQVAEGQGIKPEDSYNPIWVMGKLTTEETTTDLAAAGYYIEEAIFEPYTDQQ